MSMVDATLHGEEESLSSGIGRRIQDARDMQELMGNYVSDLERLKNQCDKSKLELTRLRDERAIIETELARLKADRAHEESQLQAVQIEYAAALEDNAYLAAGEASTSAELAELGRVRRRLCFQEEKGARLEEQLRQAEDAHNSAVEAERAVAAGLRERIGRLERRLREKEGETSASMARVRSASAENEHELAVMRAEVERLTRESADARDALALEVKRSKAEARRAEKLADELQTAREQGRLFADAARERDRLRQELNTAKAELELAVDVKEERDRLKAELARAQPKPTGDISMEKDLNGAQPLQSVSPNTPLTPSKRESGQSPKSPSSRELAHVKRELAHTKSQHTSLKAAHDELKDKYTKLSHKREKEKQHFKEFHTVYMAKKEAKRKRREMQASSSVAGSGAPTPPGPSPPSAANSSAPAAPAEAKVGFTQNDMPEPPAKRARQSPPPARVAPRASPPRVLVPERLAITPQPGASKSVPERAAPVSEPPRLSSDRTVSAPTTTPAARTPSGTGVGLTRQASRVTPWLGGSTSRTSVSSSRKRPVQRDSFGSDSDEDTPHPIASPAPAARTPLVRDRTGTASTSTSDGLRLQALKRAATEDTTAKKLVFEGLSAAERAAERRKLSRLSTAERREVYAPYKGKGRYVAPEDVKKTFADEFEIDPAKNDGVKHQFDSVVRNREERKKLHGGDCECCRSYYEAVGDIPRFHSGPVWRDDPSVSAATSPSKTDGDRSVAVDIEDHQNRVSRHREVWRRPPTPPDYWKIGFPTTQDVEKVNRQADEMVARREAEVRREAAHRDSKWRKKV